MAWSTTLGNGGEKVREKGREREREGEGKGEREGEVRSAGKVSIPISAWE